MKDQATFERRARDYQQAGWRLALVNATAVLPAAGAAPDDEGAFDLTWSFVKDGALEHVRARVLPGEEVPSLSHLFGSAFLYENEIRELFGVNVVGVTPDFEGELYQTATRVPFSPRAIRARLEAKGKKP